MHSVCLVSQSYHLFDCRVLYTAYSSVQCSALCVKMCHILSLAVIYSMPKVYCNILNL